MGSFGLMAGAAATPRPWLLVAALLALVVSPWAAPAFAQAETAAPEVTRRVTDGADMLPRADEEALNRRLYELQQRTSRQLLVVTVPNLGGQPIETYSIALAERSGAGGREADNGAILLIARDDRRIRIEVGDGLEPILTDAMSHIIIRDRITPRFKANDYPGGINAGVDAIVEQLSAPPEEAERRALAAGQSQRQAQADGGGDTSIMGVIFWIFVLLFVIGAMGRRGRRGRRYGSRRRRGGWGSSPVIIWGGDWGGGGGGFGGFGGGGGGGGGIDFGGFSGGGGSFGGGGASGSW
ncbi:MAG TPA: TPM domain-containing protein [Allosphingosinicella sp.]|jgi:uncharacterized protein